MSAEMKEAMLAVEKEKNISREVLFEAIESALITACRNTFGKVDNVRAEIDRETCDFHVYAEKEVVEFDDDVMDPATMISLNECAQLHIDGAQIGDLVEVPVSSEKFSRIAAQIAKGVILQKIREEERNAVLNYFLEKQKNVVTGIVQRLNGRNITVDLGKADGFLSEKEQVPGEHLQQNDRIKVYVVDVRNNQKGAPRILVSRTHPDLVRCLFEQEVAEIADGTVEIVSIAREPGSRTKIAVWSNNPNVDPIGACVGPNGQRVGEIVRELRGEKIDIVNWDDNPGNLIQNALSPAKIVAVFADPEEKTAKVVVPDYQLSLAIGREGQNARLAARLTGYKIDIKSETQAKDAPGFRYEDYLDDEEGADDEWQAFLESEFGPENPEGAEGASDGGYENADAPLDADQEGSETE
ncbi:MAG: transcription termination/antitermination protein NusA [Lachnospiraceae bacterium]|nr:transcription termination/antitermination protein NusA [Lachnospiraceae bacterium]